MTCEVKLLPSGRTFTAESQETLLEAALRAGLAPTYSCNNGSCGQCKARLVSGTPGTVRFHDYVFTEAEKAQGYLLMCSTTAGSDLVIEAREAVGAEDIPEQHIVTRVHKLARLDEDVMGVHLRTPRSQTLRFLAGQHVRLDLPGVSPRNKSIASCPCNAMHLELHVQRVPGDPFSDHVFCSLGTMQAVPITGPFGNFTLREDTGRPVIFLAYETGFAPIKSLIEHAIALEFVQPMHLYWVVRRDGGHYLSNQCRAWADALDEFTYTPLVAHETTPERALLQAANRVVAEHPDLGAVDVYVNGPEHAMGSTRALLAEHGLPPAQLYVDFLERT